MLSIVVGLSAAQTQDPLALIAALNKTLQDSRRVSAQLAGELLNLQVMYEEFRRSNENSGVRRVRAYDTGSQPYHERTYIGGSVLAMHDHNNYIDTVGMGEFIATLNGVQFQTRHNDYKLRMAAPDAGWKFESTVPIPPPPVPPSVLAKPTVAEQVAEMQTYFKAWVNNDAKLRADFATYFRPILCYLEGQWTAATSNIDEPFLSDRHFLAAKTWSELLSKVRYTAATGSQDGNENVAVLPTTILDVDEDTGAVKTAQWNYRILCHPLSKPLPLNRFQLADDAAARLSRRWQMKDLFASRGARFRLNPFDNDNTNQQGSRSPQLIDKLMGEVPGKGGYKVKLTDTGLTPISGGQALDASDGLTPLNAGFYSRYFKSGSISAMGVSTRHRGFSDMGVFMAKTNHTRVAALNATLCEDILGISKCTTVAERWTYAIPLEIIFDTPLRSWNPYALPYGEAAVDSQYVTAGGRNGDKVNVAKAYNGTSKDYFYITPAEFYNASAGSNDAADTARDAVGVWRAGLTAPVLTCPAGIRIFTQSIPGVGSVRQRWPIAPVADEGSSVWKELSALRDIVMEPDNYGYLRRAATKINGGNGGAAVTLKPLDLRLAPAPDGHVHYAKVTPDQYGLLLAGTQVQVETDGADHTHLITLALPDPPTVPETLVVVQCDMKRDACPDGHPLNVSILSSGAARPPPPPPPPPTNPPPPPPPTDAPPVDPPKPGATSEEVAALRADIAALQDAVAAAGVRALMAEDKLAATQRQLDALQLAAATAPLVDQKVAASRASILAADAPAVVPSALGTSAGIQSVNAAFQASGSSGGGGGGGGGLSTGAVVGIMVAGVVLAVAGAAAAAYFLIARESRRLGAGGRDLADPWLAVADGAGGAVPPAATRYEEMGAQAPQQHGSAVPYY